ncbi:MAG TPA: VC0807 family protein [Stellaceae bacterium]|nr:VC0807 family protein [Stellaceae bacterium]
MANSSNAGDPVPAGPNIGRVLLLDIALPALTVFLLQRNGFLPLQAYAAASLFPIGSVLGAWRRRRSVDVVGIGVVLGIASGILVGRLTTDPRFALVRAAPGFAVFGIACFVSLATKRPLMFFVARAFAAGGDPQKIAQWNQRLGQPRFHAAMRRLTLVWGTSSLIESCAAFACAFLLPGQISLIVEPLLAFAILGALLAWSRSLQRRAQPIEPALLSVTPENSHA